MPHKIRTSGSLAIPSFATRAGSATAAELAAVVASVAGVIAPMSPARIKGRIASGTGPAQNLTMEEVRTALTVRFDNMPPTHMLGRLSNGSGPAEELTATQSRSILDVRRDRQSPNRMLGRVSPGTGASEELTPEQVQAMLGFGEIEADIDAVENRASFLETLAVDVRPGGRPDLFTRSVADGDPAGFASLSEADVQSGTAEGDVIVLEGDDLVAVKAKIPLEPDRKYKIRGRSARIIDPADPFGDAVQPEVYWFNQSQIAMGTPFTNIGDPLALETDDNFVEFSKVISRNAGAGIDIVAPAGTRFFTPAIETWGTTQKTGFSVIAWEDITDAGTISPNIAAAEARISALEGEDLPDRVADLEASATAPDVKRFKTRAQAAAETIPVSVDVVETLGLAAEADGGGGLYTRVGGATATSFQSADGQHWELSAGLATQPQAEAGTDNIHRMTPLRVQQGFGYMPYVVPNGDAARSLRARGADKVNILDWIGVGSGVDSDAAALKAAVLQAQAAKRKLWLPGNSYVADEIITPIAAPTTGGISIEGDGIGLTKLLHAVPGGPILQRIGQYQTVALSPTVAVASLACADSQTLSTTAALSPDQFVIVQDESVDIISNRDGAVICRLGEIARVKTVVSGTQIKYHGTLENAYSTASVVRPFLSLVDGFSLASMDIENAIPGANTSGAVALSMFRVRHLTVDNVRALGLDDDFARLDHCMDFRLTNNIGDDFHIELNLTPYMFNLGAGCWGGSVINNIGRRGRHILTGGSTPGLIECSHVIVAHNQGYDSESAPIDQHPGCRHWKIDDNKSVSAARDIADTISAAGVQLRGRKSRLINHTSIGFARGALFYEGEDLTLDGGDFSECDIGYEVDAVPRFKVIGSPIIRNPRDKAALFQNSGSLPMDDVRVDAFDVLGDPADAVMYFDAFYDTWEIARPRAYDATSAIWQNGAAEVPHWAKFGHEMPLTADYENIPRKTTQDTAVSGLTSGRMLLTSIVLPRRALITKIGVMPFVAASGQSNYWHAMYDRDLNLLGVTNDLGAVPAAGGIYIRLSVAVPFYTAYEGLYWIGPVCVATTMPTFNGRPIRAAMTIAPGLARQFNTGLTDPASAPAVASNDGSATIIPWMTVSGD